jgi:hypothetical protein
VSAPLQRLANMALKLEAQEGDLRGTTTPLRGGAIGAALSGAAVGDLQ